MPKFAPAPQALQARFDAVLARYPKAERHIMFSYPSGFINGQMFICTFGSAVMLRLSEEDRAAFLKLPGAAMFEPTPGRPMKQYVRIPDNIWASDKKLDKWITKSMTYAASLPPKKPRTRKKPAAKK